MILFLWTWGEDILDRQSLLFFIIYLMRVISENRLANGLEIPRLPIRFHDESGTHKNKKAVPFRERPWLNIFFPYCCWAPLCLSIS